MASETAGGGLRQYAGRKLTGHGGSPVAVEEAEHFFVHFDQKGPVKLVAEHNQARVGQ